MIYTVADVEKANEPADPTYGQKYYVRFEGQEQSVQVSRKSDPQIGEEMDGTIKEGRFKKTPKPYTPGAPQQRYDGPKRADNSDGQRQGMCINNASAYVLYRSEHAQKPLDPKEWATTVAAYANELYKLGDLEGTTFDEVTPEALSEAIKPITEGPKHVQEIFGKPEAA